MNAFLPLVQAASIHHHGVVQNCLFLSFPHTHTHTHTEVASHTDTACHEGRKGGGGNGLEIASFSPFAFSSFLDPLPPPSMKDSSFHHLWMPFTLTFSSPPEIRIDDAFGLGDLKTPPSLLYKCIPLFFQASSFSSSLISPLLPLISSPPTHWI